MCGDSKAIVKTFRQILDIYKQIDMLMETSKELMETTREWTQHSTSPGNEDHYHKQASYISSKIRIVRIPFYLQRQFVSNSQRTQIKYIAVMIDDEEPCIHFEPVVVGTTLKFVNTRKSTADWDGYWWYHSKWKHAEGSNSERHGPWTLENYEVNEIQEKERHWMKDKVRSNLQSVHTFGVPLVDVTNTKTLDEKIIERLLAV